MTFAHATAFTITSLAIRQSEETHVHLMQSDRSPPTPRPLGANPRNARPHNITLAITKNGTRFNGLTLLQSHILRQKSPCLSIIVITHSQRANSKRVQNFKRSRSNFINLQAPCVLHIGQAFRYSPENAFYIFNQQIYLII